MSSFLYPEQTLDEIEKICDRVYRKTFDEVTWYLSKENPLSPIKSESSNRSPIPKRIRFQHAPDGDDINAMVSSLASGDVEATDNLKTELEDNIIVSIRHAVSDAIMNMSRRDRFNGPHKARLTVAQKSVTLVRLQPTSISTQK